jgi:hypothetical protein
VKELEVIDIIDVSIRAHTLHTPAVGNNVMGSLLRLFNRLLLIALERKARSQAGWSINPAMQTPGVNAPFPDDMSRSQSEVRAAARRLGFPGKLPNGSTPTQHRCVAGWRGCIIYLQKENGKPELVSILPLW